MSKKRRVTDVEETNGDDVPPRRVVCAPYPAPVRGVSDVGVIAVDDSVFNAPLEAFAWDDTAFERVDARACALPGKPVSHTQARYCSSCKKTLRADFFPENKKTCGPCLRVRTAHARWRRRHGRVHGGGVPKRDG